MSQNATLNDDQTTQLVDAGIVFTSNLNHVILLHTRHHAANTRHLTQTNSRVKGELNLEAERLENVENIIQRLSTDLDDSASVLYTMNKTSKPALTRTRRMLTETIAKEKVKEKEQFKKS